MSQWKRLGRTPEHSAGIARYLQTKRRLVIWCDGTRNLQEWRWSFQTLRRWLKEHHGVRVNIKDWAQARCVLDELIMADVPVFGEDTIWLAGYSRGFAVAQCLALLLGADRCIVHGFAGKRVGNRAFVDKVFSHNRAQRGDVVPLLPPWYADAQTDWYQPWAWPVKAHLAMAHSAAIWRHNLLTGANIKYAEGV